MKAAVLYQAGGPENFSVETRSMPVPAQDQVLIRVKAFGLNRSELMTRKGLSPSVRFPRILGIECAGEVETDPSGQYRKGQQVMAFMGGMGRDYDGSYAEYAVLPASVLHPFRSTLSWELLGAIPEMFQTVHGSLHLALAIQKGETILIRGGTSSIGMLSARVSGNSGLTVIATTRNPQKQQALLDNGASYVLIDDGTIREKVLDIFPDGVNKVLELVGTSTLKDSLGCAKRGGTVCMAGMLAENWSIPDFAPMEYIPATVRFTIYDSGQVTIATDDLQKFIGSVEAGQVKLTISKVFTLDHIADAHEYMQSNQGSGKIVVLT